MGKTTMHTNGPNQLKLPEGPRGHFLFGHMPQIRRGPLEFLESLARDYKDVAHFRFLWLDAYLVNHPEYVRRILVDNHRNYTKQNIANQMLRPVLGNGLLISEGEFWLRQRRLIQPAFHKQRIQGFGRLMAGAAADMLERWEAHDPAASLDVDRAMMQLTLTIVGMALFSRDLSGDAETVGKSFGYINEFISTRARTVIAPPLGLPTPGNRRFHREKQALVQVVQEIIDERRSQMRREQGSGNDLLAMLLEARDEHSGEGMTDQQLQDEAMTLLLAGHETTANALTWTWYLLSQNPPAEQKLHAELDSVLGGRMPGVEDLPGLPYTAMVVKEAMRLYPPAWILSRHVVEDDRLGDYRIPGGTVVDISPYLMHRHPDYWPEPTRFEPERFTPERSEARPAYAYFPFGGGPRLCIGRDFAMVEAQIILAAVASRFKLRLVSGHQVGIDPLITLRPLGGMPMRIERRSLKADGSGGL
jgi:cytochrome P450